MAVVFIIQNLTLFVPDLSLLCPLRDCAKDCSQFVNLVFQWNQLDFSVEINTSYKSKTRKVIQCLYKKAQKIMLTHANAKQFKW